MTKKIILLFFVLSSFNSFANASGYVGFNLGSVDYGADSISSFDDPMGFEFLFGTEINRNLSFELSYADFGEADNGIPPNLRLSADALTAGALIRAKAGQTADVFLKLGMFSWDAELTVDGFGTLFTDDGIDFFYGFGVTVKSSDQLSIGARYMSYDYDTSVSSIDPLTMFSIYLQFGF